MARPEQPQRPLIVVDGLATTRTGCLASVSLRVTSKLADGHPPALDEIVPMMTTKPVSLCWSDREGWNGLPQLMKSVALTNAAAKKVVMGHRVYNNRQPRPDTTAPVGLEFPIH